MAQAQGPQGAPPLILPPARDGKTAEQITDAILGLKCIPTYYDVDRAWVVLGYFRSDKPTLQDFVRNTQDLWSFHVRQNWSRRASQARAYILDALRTMGFVSPHWKVNTRNLFLVEEDSDGRYATLGDPPKRPPRVFKDGREYIQAQAPDASGNSETLARHLESRQWLRFHRYQGFEAQQIGIPPNQHSGLRTRRFRAIPVPRGGLSLWHSLSYWRGQQRRGFTGGRSIWYGWQVKARIWTYFMQVLRDNAHQRHAFYVELERQSLAMNKEGQGQQQRWHWTHQYGKMSLIRSLYASSRQGPAAFPTFHIFYVIADYFAAQVIVFHPVAQNSGLYGNPGTNLRHYNGPVGNGPMYNRCYELGGFGLETEHAQSHYKYSYTVFGANASGPQGQKPRVRQIFLVTDDWENFDAADWDTQLANPGAPGWDDEPAEDGPADDEEEGEELPYEASVSPGHANDDDDDNDNANMDYTIPHNADGSRNGMNDAAADTTAMDRRGFRFRVRRNFCQPSLHPGSDPSPYDLVLYANRRPPCRQARYNYISDAVHAARNNNQPFHRYRLFPQPDGVWGLHARDVLPRVGTDFILTDAIYRRFRADLDIPGEIFAIPGLYPAPPPRPPPPGPGPGGPNGVPIGIGDVWQWRFGLHPMRDPNFVLDAKKEIPRAHMHLDDPLVEFGFPGVPDFGLNTGGEDPC